MPVWTATPVSRTPGIIVCRFTLFRTDSREVHIVGYNLTEGEGRVSSALIRFNRKTRFARTRSGRRYKLEGDPGYDPEGMYVFSVWRSVNGVKTYDDVTDVVLKSGLKAAIALPPTASPASDS